MKIILQENDVEKDFFKELVSRIADEVVVQLERRIESLCEKSNNVEELWVSSGEAKQILGVKSNKKIQALRDQNLIRYSQHGRTVRYYKPGLYDFIEQNVVE